MLWWRTRRAPSTGDSFHTGASSQGSRPVPRPVVLDLLAPPSPGAVDRADDVSCSLAGRAERGSRSLRVTVPQIQAHLFGLLLWSRSLRARAAGGSLHTGAILTALPAGGVSGSALYSSAFCRPVAFQASYRRVAPRPSKLCSSSQT